MSELEFRVAIRDALAEELERDPAVIFFGEDVAAEQGGVFAVTPGLQERFGADRVFDTPISELALAGAAFGAAVDRDAAGDRDHVRRLHGAADGLAGQPGGEALVRLQRAGKRRRSSSARRSAPAGGSGPCTRRTRAPGFRASRGSRSSHPSSPADAKGLLKSAIRDDNPVIFLEHKRLYSIKGPEPDAETVPLGEAAVVA